MGKSMPEDAHLRPPAKTGCHTIEECDEVLARIANEPMVDAVVDAWLDERLSAMAVQRVD